MSARAVAVIRPAQTSSLLPFLLILSGAGQLHAFGDFDHGLNKAINKIREALNDSAPNPRFVETVARRGYRFIADVSAVEEPSRSVEPVIAALPEPKDPNREPAENSAPARQPPNSIGWKVAAGLLLLILAILFVWNSRRTIVKSPDVRSLAVLPLENLSSDASQEYFADGMTDELITALGLLADCV